MNSKVSAVILILIYIILFIIALILFFLGVSILIIILAIGLVTGVLVSVFFSVYFYGKTIREKISNRFLKVLSFIVLILSTISPVAVGTILLTLSFYRI